MILRGMVGFVWDGCRCVFNKGLNVSLEITSQQQMYKSLE